MRAKSSNPKEPTEQVLKDIRRMTRRHFSAEDKIRIDEQSQLPVKRALDQFGIARRTIYRWYDRYLDGEPEALEDWPSAPGRVWNRIAPGIQGQIVEMALEQSEQSLREMALRFTDKKRYFVSEATV